MARIIFLVGTLILLGSPFLAAAQPRVTRFVVELPAPAPPPLGWPERSRPTLAQSFTCRQAFADPTVSVAPASASPWQQLRGVRAFSDEFASSQPQSLFLEESSPADVDAVGQSFGPLPANLAEIAGALRFRLAANSTGDGDKLRVALYNDASLEPAGLIFQSELDLATRDDATWQSFEWEVRDAPTIALLRERTSATFVVSTVNAANGATQRLWLDDLTLDLCTPGGSIGGTVRQGSAPAPNAELLLVRTDAVESRVVATTQASTDGSFLFSAVPPLAAGAQYRVWFLNRSENNTRDDSRLGFWAGPPISSFAEGAVVNNLALEIDAVELLEPAPNATVIATNATPARLTWGGRSPQPGERQRFCLYDPEQADPKTMLPLQLCGPLLDPSREPLAFSLAPSSFAAAPGFPFVYGRAYRWYVVVYSADPRSDPTFQYGYSFYERSVTFAPAAGAATAPEPNLPPGSPTTAMGKADWTLLVYVAADNALGDPRRATRTALPSAQLANLATVAANYPGVKLLTYLDNYGNGGAQFCFYPPGEQPDCTSRPEPNTAAGQDLADFIGEGRARFPATRTALLVISPGSAAGLAPDDSSGGSFLSLPRLRTAFAAAGLGGDKRLDLVIYQAPNLGTLDSLAATAPYASYMVASADQVWQVGALERIVPVLAGPGKTDAAEAARGTVRAYDAAITAIAPGSMFSMASFELSKIPAIVQGAEDLAFVVLDEFKRERATLGPILESARNGAIAYDASGNGRHNQLASASGPVAAQEDALVGLRSLALQLRDAPGAPKPVRDEAIDLLGLLDRGATSPILSTIQRSGRSLAGVPITFENAAGLAVFFPSGDRLGGQPALVQQLLHGPDAGPPRDTDWALMLRFYLADRIGEGPGGVTEAPGSGAQPPFSPGAMVRTALYLPMLQK